jgi:hypothetical protein
MLKFKKTYLLQLHLWGKKMQMFTIIIIIIIIVFLWHLFDK